MPSDGDPLHNLSNLQSRMEHVHHFLSHSLNTNTIIPPQHMQLLSTEITNTINQLIANGTSLLTDRSHPLNHSTDLGFPKVEILDHDWDIVEIDAVQLLAEHLHFCDFCGKGFKRDANLRMHMRAHGNKFKTLEALAKPEKPSESNRDRRTRFSCPFAGCSRNKMHSKFRPLKSVICVKNHFKRSHCPKMYSCNRCHKKKFSVLADLKSHLKHCGETKWKCSCGTSFSRKDKLFGHMALFEGHMPAVGAGAGGDEDQKAKGVASMPDDHKMDTEILDDLPDGFDDFCIQDILGGMDWSL